jgi:hypothetical protein
MAQADATHIALKRLWAQLPDTMISPSGGKDVTRDESLRAIISASHLFEGDYAGASGRRAMLESMGALTRRQTAAGGIEFIKSQAFPDQVDNGPGSAIFNATLAARAAEERARFESDLRAREAAQASLNAPGAVLRPRRLHLGADEHCGRSLPSHRVRLGCLADTRPARRRRWKRRSNCRSWLFAFLYMGSGEKG